MKQEGQKERVFGRGGFCSKAEGYCSVTCCHAGKISCRLPERWGRFTVCFLMMLSESKPREENLMKQSRRPFSLVGALIFSALLFSLPAVSRAQKAGQKKSVAFLPFAVHAPHSLSYLRDGIREMLASRLAANAGVMVVSKTRVDQAVRGKDHLDRQALISIGRSLGADYLVTGSFTSLGGGVSLDASVYEPAHPGPPQRFYATADSKGEVIPAIDRLAGDMAEKLFHVRKVPSPGTTQVGQGVQTGAALPFQTDHPERSFLIPAAPPAAPPQVEPQVAAHSSGVFIRPEARAAGFTKTRNFDFGLQAFDVGDVDGDGAPELVLADRSTVYIYRQKGGRLSEMAHIPVTDGYRIRWISVADTNGNGRAEIYVCAASATEPSSLAVEWNGKKFVSLFKGVRWYIRAMDLPGEGPVLLGQRPAVDGIFLPGLFRLRYKDGSVTKGQRLDLPDWVNLFAFSLADVNGDGEAEIISINQEDQLRVTRQDGEVLWKSGKDYGGTTRYLGGLPILGAYHDRTRYNPETGDLGTKRYYLPSRILVADLNGDKIPDIIVSKNKGRVTNVLKNLRSYSSGEIYAFSWNGVGMAELWHTRTIDGAIIDYQLQKEKKGPDLLRVGLDLGGGFLSGLTGRKSTILAFPINYANPAH